MAERHGSRSQPVQIPGRRPLTKASHENGLDRLANLENVADEIVVDGPHARALVGTGDDEALALQSPQGLPDGVRAHRIARREFLGLEPRARFETPATMSRRRSSVRRWERLEFLDIGVGRQGVLHRLHRVSLCQEQKNSIDFSSDFYVL